MEEPRIPEQEVYIWTIYFKINIEWINVWKKIALITFELHNYMHYQNQNSLLVKRQNDNTSPGDWPRKISP